MNELVERVRARRALTLILAGTLLAGCGGNDEAVPVASPSAVSSTEARPAAAAAPAARVAMPTQAIQGVDFRNEPEHGPGDRPGGLPPARAIPAVQQAASFEPVDRAARTRRGLYVSRSMAERVDFERRGDVVWIDASCCGGHALGSDDLDLAVLMAFGVQAAKDLGPDAPFFVYGSDLRQAARLADRLTAAGVSQAYLVTP